MAYVLTWGGVDLMSTYYEVVAFDIGTNEHEEEWLDPWSSDDPTLAGARDKKTKAQAIIKVKGSTLAELIGAVEAVRDIAALETSTLAWTPDSVAQATRTWDTFRSAIDPVPLDSPTAFKLLESGFVVPRWGFSIWRKPYYAGESKPPVI
jgi:hypothetical protein